MKPFPKYFIISHLELFFISLEISRWWGSTLFALLNINLRWNPLKGTWWKNMYSVASQCGVKHDVRPWLSAHVPFHLVLQEAGFCCKTDRCWGKRLAKIQKLMYFFHTISHMHMRSKTLQKVVFCYSVDNLKTMNTQRFLVHCYWPRY